MSITFLHINFTTRADLLGTRLGGLANYPDVRGVSAVVLQHQEITF